MTPEEFQELLRYFARARDKYKATGDLPAAQSCEDAIATAHRIETDLRISTHYSNQRAKSTTPRRTIYCQHIDGRGCDDKLTYVSGFKPSQ